jgi:hypothetical protein
MKVAHPAFFVISNLTPKETLMVKLLAKPYQQFQTRNGTQYVADAYGVLASVLVGTDIVDLIDSGALPLPGNPQSVDNLAATADPTASNDNTQDYGPGSLWLNTTSNRAWLCESASTGAAVWVLNGVVPGVGIEPSSMLTYFGGGTQSFADAGVIFRYQSLTGTGNGNDTTEDTLTTFSLPASSLDVAGRTLQITASGSLANNAHSKTARLYFGSSITSTTGAQTGANVGWQLQLQVQKIASNSQIGFYSPIVGTTHGGISLPLTGTETDTSAITIKVTGQTGTAAANDVMLNSLVIEALN